MQMADLSIVALSECGLGWDGAGRGRAGGCKISETRRKISEIRHIEKAIYQVSNFDTRYPKKYQIRTTTEMNSPVSIIIPVIPHLNCLYLV